MNANLKCILCVEDEPEMIDLIRLILGRRGFEVKGAAGGVEAVFSALAVHHQVAPPTTNIFNQDPLCDLDYVPNTARQMKINVALSNSFGFGGTNGTLVFGRV